MMLHAIVGMGNGQLMTRTTTCACNDCFLDGFNRNTTCAWNHEHIEEKAVEVVDTSSTTEHTGQEISDEIADECEQQASAHSVCSSNIDDCIKKIVTSLQDYCTQWCRKEIAEITALDDCRTKIFSMAMNKIYFYDTNPLALPHSSKFNKQNLCKLLEALKSKFVIVSADKAANNVIII
ncbi:hypothetical protein DPMN_069313 [Dreissena polymorpha]|uniref:Uncharacterized protein n=1 Tax=Dreissena polymorpha TaxID=45954 RepID=A0A9D4BWZ9_DREPO|nr:hypothetical protein DPMN_069313 [Dreissena polymorpha]